ncbi:MAG: NifB/NifX family molybdenum-iron cluster-binding protein [Candidatus Omnitrophica bacterium]|nr:NifB/NifX family molybdenum-iron cluster-binding protein [Candidatus Omnitrophota bacterium]
MKIAISTDGEVVSEHFGRCPSFTIVDIQEGKVGVKEVISNPGHHPGFLPEFLGGKGVECIIAGGMGQRAIQLFSERGIQVIVGVNGAIDEVMLEMAKGKLHGGDSSCKPGAGKGYGLDKTVCDHGDGH